MYRRTLLVPSALVLLAGLGGCMPPYPRPVGAASPGVRGPIDVSVPPPARTVAILLPLTGPQAELGQNMLRAAQLAYGDGLDARDTAGTPDGAATAARAAMGAGAVLILGPLTSAETAAVGPLARAANVPVLAFTSDPAQAQPGVWTLGVTPDQQVRRLVGAVAAEGKTRFAAVLPENPFGAALGAGLRRAATAAGLPAPAVQTYPSGFASLNTAFKTATAYDRRRGDIEARQKAARAGTDPDARSKAAAIGAEPVPPPPFDALLLGAVGEGLGQAVPLLAYYDVKPTEVRILGPALWARDAARQPDLSGAWFAAPDPALRTSFAALYTGKYNTPPRDLADIAYDAAGIAKVAAGDRNGLFRPEGFAGADGLIGLSPDGQTRRGLAIFEVDRGGAHIVQPAPQSLSAPGS